MRPMIVFFALALALVASGPTAAQGDPHTAYQKALLARPLPSEVKAFCDKNAGAGNAAEHEICRVTRLFIADIKADRDKGFPPLTDIKYADKAETNQIMDRMTKYGG